METNSFINVKPTTTICMLAKSLNKEGGNRGSGGGGENGVRVGSEEEAGRKEMWSEMETRYEM